MRHKKRKKKVLMVSAYLLLFSVILALLLGSLNFETARPLSEGVYRLDTMTACINGGKKQTVSLPYNFEGLPPRTPVTLTASILPQSDDTVYIKSVYSPAKIYLNDRLAYEFGKPEHYPRFMIDPATEVHIVETHGDGTEMTLRMEFLSPAARDTLTIHPPMIGSSKEIILERFQSLGPSFLLSITQIVYGISLIIVSICILFMDQKGAGFLWLGLFSLLTGLWSFGENNFTAIIFKNPTFLYLLAFIGMFTFIIPLLRFTRTMIDFEHPKLIWILELLVSGIAALALLLQLLGKAACSESVFLFHPILPVILIILTLCTIHEYVHYQNVSAKRFILPISFLTVTGILELLNYKLFLYAFSSLFQIGILFFLLVMGIFSGLSVKDSIDLKNKQKELTFERKLMEIQIREQQNRDMLLAQHEQLLRRQRHDLRHHLVAVQELVNTENTELQDYLQSLMQQIPKSEQLFCENRTVNAVASHYASVCRSKEIPLTMNLVVPPFSGGISDSELCVIFGNLLENAVEACERLDSEQRFIRLNSSMQYDILTITMDNSFNGIIKSENGMFYSSKRDDWGVGLTSIQSVAQKFGGDVEFRHDDSVFFSSVYLKLS